MDVPLFWKRHAPGSNQTGQKAVSVSNMILLAGELKSQ